VYYFLGPLSTQILSALYLSFTRKNSPEKVTKLSKNTNKRNRDLAIATLNVSNNTNPLTEDASRGLISELSIQKMCQKPEYGKRSENAIYACMKIAKEYLWKVKG